jgi:hypothetical protein
MTAQSIEGYSRKWLLFPGLLLDVELGERIDEVPNRKVYERALKVPTFPPSPLRSSSSINNTNLLKSYPTNTSKTSEETPLGLFGL